MSHLNKTVPADSVSSRVLIDLGENESHGPRSVDQLVQHKRYEHLREQVITHLDSLKASTLHLQADYPTGSGWTQFLDGTRGAGKSTFLSLAKSALEGDYEVKSRMAFIASIDPSRIEQNEIILLVILQQLRKRVDHCLKERSRPEDDFLREEWRRAFSGVAGGLSLFAKGYHPLDDLDPDLFLDWGLERASDGLSLRRRLHGLFAIACRILGVQALMLAFDDADTDSTHAIHLLECVRKYLDAPLIMVLVTGDLELYSLLVRQHFAQTIAGKREAALELQRRSVQRDRSAQYLRMFDHLEEQYLLKLFPIVRRTQLQPLWSVIHKDKDRVNYLATYPKWTGGERPVKAVVDEIVRRGLRVKKESDVAIYAEFLLKQPLRSALQVLAHCAPHLEDSSSDMSLWAPGLTTSLSRALEGLALTSLYKFSVDTDELAAGELPALVRAVFDLSLQDGDIDTAPYLRPMSAERDIRACFAALAAQVPNFCAQQPGTTLRYLLRGPGSVSIFSLARHHPGVKDLPSREGIHKFESYMGIGRREDGLDWARRATAVIALPSARNFKARVVLPGVIGLLRKGRKEEHTARTAIRRAIERSDIHFMPVFALGMVDVAHATDTRTYGSIFLMVGLIEKLLSAGSDQEAKNVFDNAYPSVTVSAPDWSSQGSLEEAETTEQEGQENAPTKHQNLWESTQEWIENVRNLAGNVTPSAIFLGKVWTRLFFSLEKAADELRPRDKFSDVMEIFALCVINAFLVEEAEHHLAVAPSQSDANIDRSNPRTSATTFIKKLQSATLTRQALPLTSIVATCPLILGLLDDQKAYGEALKAFFPEGTVVSDIKALLRPKALGQLMAKVSVAGEPRKTPQASDAAAIEEEDGAAAE